MNRQKVAHNITRSGGIVIASDSGYEQLYIPRVRCKQGLLGYARQLHAATLRCHNDRATSRETSL